MKEVFIFVQEAKRLNIHGTVHAGEGGPAANVKIVSINQQKYFKLEVCYIITTRVYRYPTKSYFQIHC